MGRGQELLDAARKGDKRTVEKILAQITRRSGPFTSLRRGAGVNVQYDNGYTPLHHACLNGHREIVHLLLSVDASPCVVDKMGATPLHLAAWKGDSNVVSMLLNHNNPPVNIDQQTNRKETALVIAAQSGYTDVVSLLIKKGADLTLKNDKDESALDMAAQNGKLETVQLLINARPQLIDPYRYLYRETFTSTPLHRASQFGHKEVVAYLIDAGIDPNIRTENGTALHEGVKYLSAGVVKVLLAKGADLKAKDRKGQTVHCLLANYSEESTRKVKKVIREYEAKIRSTYESEDDPLPDQDSPISYVNIPGKCYKKVLPTLSKSNEALTNIKPKHSVTNIRSVSHMRSLPPSQIKNKSDKKLLYKINCYSSLEKEATDKGFERKIGHRRVHSYVNQEEIINAIPVYTDMSPNVSALKKKPKPAPKPPLDFPILLINKCHADNPNLMDELSKKLQFRHKRTSSESQKYQSIDCNASAKSYHLKLSDLNDYANMYKSIDALNVYENLPDDEKALLNGESAYVYTTMDSNKDFFRKSEPNMMYVDMFRNTTKDNCEYITMDNDPKQRRPLSEIGKYRRCEGLHMKGEEGCLYSSLDYLYTYVLNHQVKYEDLSPFIRNKIKADCMPCFCHEKKKADEEYFSCEDFNDIYVLMDKNTIYNSLSEITSGGIDDTKNEKVSKYDTLKNHDKEYDALNDKVFVPFKQETNSQPSTSNENSQNKRLSIVLKKKFDHIRLLLTDWKC